MSIIGKPLMEEHSKMLNAWILLFIELFLSVGLYTQGRNLLSYLFLFVTFCVFFVILQTETARKRIKKKEAEARRSKIKMPSTGSVETVKKRA